MQVDETVSYYRRKEFTKSYRYHRSPRFPLHVQRVTLIIVLFGKKRSLTENIHPDKIKGPTGLLDKGQAGLFSSHKVFSYTKSHTTQVLTNEH